jgi:hypothetical protein
MKQGFSVLWEPHTNNLNIGVPVPTPPILTDCMTTNGSFQFSFTNSIGALFRTLTASNLTTLSSNWATLGSVSEISPGHFQFSDSGTTNHSQRFYRVRSQ